MAQSEATTLRTESKALLRGDVHLAPPAPPGCLELPEKEYREMEHPTFLIHGRDDYIIPLETSLHLLEHRSHMQLRVFGRCRRKFNSLLRRFLDGEL